MIKIPLTQGKIAFIDDEDWDLVNQYKWWAHWDRCNWYAVTRTNRETFLSMHRLIKNVQLNKEVDHRNGNGLDNQKHNLRICTHAENSYNQKKHRSYNGNKTSSIYKGVNWYKKKDKYRTRIMVNGKSIHLGYFASEIEAAEVYNTAALEYHKEYANLNEV